jgi:hypothetical protein
MVQHDTLTAQQAEFVLATAAHEWDVPRVLANPEHHRDYTDTTVPWQALDVAGHLWQVTITDRTLTYADHRDASGHRSPVTIRWDALRDHACALDNTQRQALADALRESRTAQIEYPASNPPAWTQGCGRVHGEGPLTAAQQGLADYYATYNDTLRIPAQQRIDAAHDQAHHVIAAALTCDDEPRDLFDLLAL